MHYKISRAYPAVCVQTSCDGKRLFSQPLGKGLLSCMSYYAYATIKPRFFFFFSFYRDAFVNCFLLLSMKLLLVIMKCEAVSVQYIDILTARTDHTERPYPLASGFFACTFFDVSIDLLNNTFAFEAAEADAFSNKGDISFVLEVIHLFRARYSPGCVILSRDLAADWLCPILAYECDQITHCSNSVIIKPTFAFSLSPWGTIRCRWKVSVYSIKRQETNVSGVLMTFRKINNNHRYQNIGGRMHPISFYLLFVLCIVVALIGPWALKTN